MSGVSIHERPNIEILRSICANLRPEDRVEIGAIRTAEQMDPSYLARSVADQPGFQWAFCTDRGPAAVLGATPNWPGVWTAWAFGTSEWPRAVVSLTKFVRRVYLPTLARSGVHRLHAYSIETHDEGHRWMRALGAVQEGRLPRFGQREETFVLYAMDPRRPCALTAVPK